MNAPDHLVADAADRLFAKHAAEAESAPLSRAFWNEFTGAGLDQVLAFESETGYHDAVSVLRAAGYHAVAAPIAEAVLARWLAAKAGWELDNAVISVAFSENDFERSIFQRVPWGRDAGTVLAVTQSGVGRIETAGVQIEQGTNLAGEPRDEVLFDKNVNLTIAHCKINSSEAYALAALLRAAQMAGAMERALDLAIEHANTRVQFGRQIGKFQAVQQMLAQLASHAAAAAAAVDLGADGLAAGDGLLEAAIAKSRAGEAAGFAAEISHQVIGAMGFTMEHALQRCTRRLWSWRDEYGNEAFWNARIGEAALKADASGAWPLIVERPWLKYAEAP